MRPFAVIEAPSMLGVGLTGVQELPTALKAAGLMTALEATHAGRIEIPPYSPIRDPETMMLNPDSARVVALRLAQVINRVLDEGRFPLVLGGDCSIEIGMALALRRRGQYGLFFLDGHADFYQAEAELNGEISSMELALMTGRGHESLSNIDDLSPLFRDVDVVVFGFRDDEDAQREGSQDVRISDMHIFDLAHVREIGVERAIDLALPTVTKPELDGFWIHLDADVLNNTIMPAVDYPLPIGGLDFDELSAILRRLIASGRAVGISITIFNPRLDTDGTIARNFTASLIAGLS